MICEICRESIATVHLTEIVNNAKKEIHLCEGCAQTKGVAIHANVKNLSLPEFFGQLAEPRPDEAHTGNAARCQVCGLTYRQFRSSGKLGCSADYRVFRDELDQLLVKIHGGVQHRGKVPDRVGTQLHRQQELVDLKERLRAAVEREEYEHAADIRDRIHNLEREQTCD
ncbi:MAG: UvrB/UvrC motif-containing protein [Planctomycetota bacterium]